MSCYFRHIKFLFEKAGIEVTPENKRKVDQSVHNIMDTEYKDCPVTWKKIKAEILADPEKEEAFIRKLKKASS